jgi:hypothetical protein
MSDEDKALIKAFIKNKPMADAVKRALLSGLLPPGDPAQNWVFNVNANLPDAEYAQKIKAYGSAVLIVENTFNNLKHMASSNPQPVVVNEAR